MSDSVVLASRRIYILPTRHGLLFALVLAVLLLTAINYGNGLVYLLVFTLTGVAVVSMLYTQRNLLGLGIRPGNCAPVFAGQTARFAVCLVDRAARARPGLWVATPRGAAVRAAVPAGGEVSIELELPAPRRGWLDCPPLTVATDFPLGLMRSWARAIRLEQRCLVYPLPAPRLPHGLRAVGAAGEAGDEGEGEDFIGLTPLAPGESPSRVSWKAVARGQGMLAKRFGGGGRETLWLDWEALAPLDTEARLSALARAVLEAEQAGRHYGLRLPRRTIAPDGGDAHRHACLRALALFGP